MNINTWECGFCRRRSRADKRIVLTIDQASRMAPQRVRLCDLECLRRLLALWEELETKRLGMSKAEVATENEFRTYVKGIAVKSQEWLDTDNRV